jgi:two-component system, OmpR family, phosphate regulon sensor histidine kinase PhoR
MSDRRTNLHLVLRVVTRVLALAVPGALLGAAAGRPWAGVSAALAIALGYEWLQLLRLLRWLRSRDITAAPGARGAWGEAITLVVRLLRSRRRRKRQFMRLLRVLRRATAALPDGVVMLSSQAEIAWFNRVAARLLHLNRRTDRGLRIDNLVRYPEFSRYLHSKQYQHAVVVRGAGETASYLSLHLVPFDDGEQLLLVRDVTRETLLETMRKDFVANASHELRSPLTVISGYLETLVTEPDVEPSLVGPLQEMQRQAQRMNGIVSDLLSLSRLETTDQEVTGEAVDMGALLQHLRRDILARPERPQRVEMKADSAAGLLGSAELLYSAFRNLLDNAANYTPAEGSITARWWVDADGAHFAVTDTGIGIAAEHLPRLTERFYRIDAGRSRATGGSGLGLAIVKHVMQKHGAELQIVSAVGKGSCFTCHFPLRRVISIASPVTSTAL